MGLLPHSFFSTETLDPASRYAVWRQSISVIYDSTLDERDEAEGFHAMTDGHLLGPLSFIRCASSRQYFQRSPAKIDRDGIDHYMIQLFIRGRCHARTRDGTVLMEPGDICVFDNAQPLDTMNEAFDVLSLFVPRTLLAPHILGADSRHYARIAAAAPLAGLMRAHLLELRRQTAGLTVEQAALMVAPTVSLLAATLNGTPYQNEGGEQAVRMAITTRLKQHIEDNLDDPALGPDSIADTFGLSRTRLYKLFQYYDGVSAYIRDRRLVQALTILSNPAERHRKIIDIAFSVGFNSEVSFIRAFRRRYGFTPSEARATPPFAPGEADHAAQMGGLEWEAWIRSI